MPESRDPTGQQSSFLAGLRQARRFQDRPVPAGTIAALLAAGRGDTTGDTAWSTLVIEDMATRNDLARIGAFTTVLAQAPVVIVIVSKAGVSTSKANDESRVGDRIMLEAGRRGLVSAAGWFGTGEARAQAHDILGLSPNQTAWGAVGVGYAETSPQGEESALDRARRLLDTLSPDKPSTDS
jgi:hypothetical protein